MVKKIFTTLLIIIGIVVGAIAVCVGVMICFPQISLFGFHYVKDNVVDSISALTISNNKVKINDYVGIEVNLDKYELTIERYNNKTDDNAGNIMLETNSSFVGLLRKNSNNELVKSFSIIPSVKETEAGKILVINAKEPTGIIIPSKMSLKLGLCIDKDDDVDNLKTVTLNVKNANTKIVGNEWNLRTENLTLTKESTTKSIEIGSTVATKELNVNVATGRVDFSKLTSETTNVNINTRSGNFEFDNVNNIKVESETNPYIKVKNLVNNQVEFKCKSGSLYAGTVNKNIVVQTDSASIEFGTVKGTITTSNYKGDKDSNANIKIGTIESMEGYDANSEDNKAIIRTVDGNITISKTNRNTYITTEKGAITIGDKNNAGVNCSVLEIETRRGQVNAYFNKDKSVKTNIVSTQSGLVNIVNINPAEGSIIESKEKTEISVTIGNLLVNDFTIKACAKPVNVYVPINAKVNLDLEGALVNVNLSSVGEEVNIDKKGYSSDVVTGKADTIGCTYNTEGASGTIIVKNDRRNSKVYIKDAI